MKEILRNSLAAVTLGTVAAIGIRTAENPTVAALELPHEPEKVLFLESHPSQTEGLDDFQKVGVTFLVSAEILGVALLSYRLSDGVMTKAEKYGWRVGVPSANFVGAAILLSEMWR